MKARTSSLFACGSAVADANSSIANLTQLTPKIYMSHISKTGRIHPGFKSLGIHHPFSRIAVPLLCGLAMLLLAAHARATITFVDNGLTTVSTFANTSTSLLLGTPFTVSSSANTLVVVVTFRNNSTSTTEAPSTLSWTNATVTQTLKLIVQKGSKAAAGGRCSAIYYLYNPTAGTGYNIAGKLSGQTGSSGALVAYTLSGVDTTVATPPSGSNSTTAVTASSLSISLSSITGSSWAAVGGAIAEADTIHTIAGGSGTPVLTTTSAGFASTTTAAMGYLSTIAGGSDTFTYSFTSGSIDGSFSVAVFTAAPSPPSIVTQPQSAMTFSNGTAQFTVTAAGAAPLSYQWYATSASAGALTAGEILTNSVALSDGVKYNGSTNLTLSISNVVTSDLTNYAVIITNSLGSITSSIASLAYWPTPTLQLRMPFTNAPGSTTALSDTSSGGINIAMNMYSNGVTAWDLNGAAGTGVTISDPNARALDMTTNTSPAQGTNEPITIAGDIVDLQASTTLATLGGGGGNITNFTATIWAKWSVPFNAGAGAGAPRLWILNAGGAGLDLAGANTVGFQYLTTNQVQFGYPGNTVSVTLPSNFQVNKWHYFALTYDGSNFKVYYGTDTSAAQLINTTAVSGQVVALGSSASLSIGNRVSDFKRGLNGWIEDFRFYNNPGDSNFVESVRASLAPLPTVPIVLTQPTPVSVYPGQIAQFAASVAGTAPITNQWYFGATKLSDGVQGDGSGISGSGTTTLTISNVTSAEAGNYTLTTTNVGGGTNSSAGILTVLATGSATNFTLNFPGTNVVQPSGADWDSVSNWNPGGLSATVSVYANPGSTFELPTGSRLRTPTTAGVQLFPGVQLTVDGSGIFENTGNNNPTNVSELRFKSSALSPTNYFSRLVLNGGELDQGIGATEVIQGAMNVASSSIIYVDSTSAQDRGYQIDSWLTGSGDLFWHEWSGGLGGINLQVTGTTNTFSGQWIVDQGALVGVGTNSLGTNNIIVGTNGLTAAVETLYNINNPNASLILGANGQMFLHQNDTFGSVIINGTSLTNGTYSYGTLNTVYPANFPLIWVQQAGSTFTGASGQITVGSVIVPPPFAPGPGCPVVNPRSAAVRLRRRVALRRRYRRSA